MKQFIFFSFLILGSGGLFGQNSAKLFSTDSMYVGTNASMSVWGNFFNTGNSGSGGSLVIDSKGIIKLYGDTFQNIGASPIGGNGSIEILNPRPAPYSASNDQVVISGGSTVSVAKFIVNTPNVVQLKTFDLKVRDSLIFVSGCIQLNNHDLIVGNGNAGVISGYNQNKYVITNANTTDTLKGFLIRELVGASDVVFPIGHALGDYTPAIINNVGTADLFKVRAFDSVYEDGYKLNIYSPTSLPASERSVKRTWDIREGTKGGSNITLTLQYNDSTGSTFYNSKKSHSYISHFIGTAPNNGGDTTSNSKWDLFKYGSTSAPTKPGTITTGSSLTNASMKSRSGITSFSPFSITAWFPGATPLPVHLISFNTKWMRTIDADLNWQIANPEITNAIVLERSIDNGPYEAVKQFIGTPTTYFYNYTDAGIANKINNHVVYRLKMIEQNGQIGYSDKKLLRKDGLIIASDISIYPSPATTELTIESDALIGDEPIKVEITNAIGQVVMALDFEPSSIQTFKQTIDIAYLNAGVYQLNIINGEIKLNKKLMISR